jgi:hypothetical protein
MASNVINIGGRLVGPDYPPLVIAEIGINHNGSLAIAKQMVDAAVAAGAEVIKHQTHIVWYRTILTATLRTVRPLTRCPGMTTSSYTTMILTDSFLHLLLRLIGITPQPPAALENGAVTLDLSSSSNNVMSNSDPITNPVYPNHEPARVLIQLYIPEELDLLTATALPNRYVARSITNNTLDDDQLLCIDSGTTYNMTAYRTDFISYESVSDMYIAVANGEHVSVAG